MSATGCAKGTPSPPPGSHCGCAMAAVLPRASAVAIRLLVLTIAAAIAVAVLVRLRLVVLPVLLALVLATVLARRPPGFSLRGLSPPAAAGLVRAGALAVLVDVLTLIVPQVSGQLDDVGDNAGRGLAKSGTSCPSGSPAGHRTPARARRCPCRRP